MCCRQHSAPPGGPYPHTVRSCAAPSSVSCPAPPPPPPPPPPRRVIPQTKKRRGGVQRGASGTVGPVGRPISHHGLVVVHLVPAAAHWAHQIRRRSFHIGLRVPFVRILLSRRKVERIKVRSKRGDTCELRTRFGGDGNDTCRPVQRTEACSPRKRGGGLALGKLQRH